MLIVYDSLTGLGRKFAKSLDQPSQSVLRRVSEPCILVTRNSGAGQIPFTTKRFLKKYSHLVAGFVVNGNSRRYPKTFCGAADKIADQYGLRHICNIEGAGTEADRQAVKTFINQIHKQPD